MKKASKSRKRDILASILSTIRIMIITVFSVSAIIYLIYQRHSVDNIMRDIDHLAIKQKQIQMENSRIERKISELSNYARISKIATDELGLIPAKKRPIIVKVDLEDLKKVSIKDKVALNSITIKKELLTSKSGL